MNVLVYGGRGVSSESLHHTIRSLRLSIGGHYDIKPISADSLATEPWEEGCKLLVVPGGRDVPFVRDLGGRACGRIKRWVNAGGGRFLGICAGAYFACEEVDFERGTALEVRGRRDLGLCPAVARGAIYPGFEYDSDAGAHAALISLDPVFGDPRELRAYYNGGCWFDFSESSGPAKDDPVPRLEDVRVLGRYGERDARPAIVASYRKGESDPAAILTGVHIEYDAQEMAFRQPTLPILPALQKSSQQRLELWNAVLKLLGLTVKQLEQVASSPPVAPTPIYMFFPETRKRVAFLATLKASKGFDPASHLFSAERVRIPVLEGAPDQEPCVTEDLHPLIVMDNVRTSGAADWSFSPDRYYSHLAEKPPVRGTDYVGRHLLYAEYINSTQTLLSQNATLTSMLPTGAILLAGDQLAGKGRGANTWLSSKGCLQFTMLLHHRDASTLTLIQYLVGLAMVEAILSEPGHRELGLGLKWPNDLYSFTSTPEGNREFRKMGGILVNSQLFNDGFLLLIGFGTNVYDTPWTRSLNDLIVEHNRIHGMALAPWSKELLLARFATEFSKLYRGLLTDGFPFDLYHRRWLHTGQVVFIESEQLKANLEGIDQDGFLIARPRVEGLLGLLALDGPEPGNPKASPILLQPDGNSFDMMKNLIKRKT